MFQPTQNDQSKDIREKDNREELEGMLLDLQCLIVPGSRLDNTQPVSDSRQVKND
jgi:hypothetical protein